MRGLLCRPEVGYSCSSFELGWFARGGQVAVSWATWGGDFRKGSPGRGWITLRLSHRVKAVGSRVRRVAGCSRKRFCHLRAGVNDLLIGAGGGKDCDCQERARGACVAQDGLLCKRSILAS